VTVGHNRPHFRPPMTKGTSSSKATRVHRSIHQEICTNIPKVLSMIHVLDALFSVASCSMLR
jgi:hypothetical protein